MCCGWPRPGAYDLAPTIASGTGPLRRQPDSGYRGADHDIINASTLGDGSIAFALDTRRARTEVHAQHMQGALVRRLVGTCRQRRPQRRPTAKTSSATRCSSCWCRPN